jgi:hypothetical protein
MKPIVATRRFSSERFALTLIVAVCTFFTACKKEDDSELPPPKPPGTKVGLLKDLVAQSLPSPLYHFDYTNEGLTTGISFASGFYIYELSYVNERLNKMLNLPNGNALFYEYKNGRVTSIREKRPNNSVVWHYTFTYDKELVKEIRWYIAAASGADSLLYRKVLLSYFTDGNLERYIDYRDITGQSLELVQTVEYSNYDQGKNVDDFNQLKEFFDHLLYLPGVRLQKNNAQKILIKGHVNDYEVTDSWTYQNNLPVIKQSKIKQTKGANAGKEIVASTTYSYY